MLPKQSGVTEPRCSSTLRDVKAAKVNERWEQWNLKHTPASAAFCTEQRVWFEFSACYSQTLFRNVHLCLAVSLIKIMFLNQIRIGFKHKCKVSIFDLFFFKCLLPPPFFSLLASSVSSLLSCWWPILSQSSDLLPEQLSPKNKGTKVLIAN